MSGDAAGDVLLRVERERALFALRLLPAYNFFLVIFFAAVGPPVASLPTFFGAVAGFATAAASLISRTGRGG